MDEQPYQSQFIRDRWADKYKAVLVAQRDGLNWLFTLNVGGVAGILTYASAKQQTSIAVILAFIAFSIGVIGLMAFAIRYYYREERIFYDFKNDAEQFRDEKMDWNQLIQRERARPIKYRDCEVLAWVSIISAFGGIVASAFAIL